MSPEKVRGYYVCYKFVCPDKECSYTNEDDVLVFAENVEQARKKVTVTCERCKKPVIGYVVLGIREARWVRQPENSF